MPTLWGRNYTRADLMRRIGDISQIGGVRSYRLDGGSGDGLPVVQVDTGAGLRFNVVPGRALDITGAWYNDVPLGYRTPTGEVDGARCEPEDQGWIRTAVLGLLVTGGLDNVGNPAVEDDQIFGLHGPLSNLAASNVYADGEWNGDEYEMWVQGRVRQAALFGENLELKRRISTSLGATSLLIHDEVTNLGARPEPALVLYHLNPGYPILDEGSQLHVRSQSRRPYDDHAASLQDDWQNYANQGTSSQRRVALINRAFGEGIGLGIGYRKDQLPYLNQWKMTGVGEYVTGIEPANCTVLGREQNRADNTMHTLQPGETVEFEVELSVLEGSKAIDKFIAPIGG